MARYALWRPRTDDPRTALGWFLRDDGFRGVPVAVAHVLVILVGVLGVVWNPWTLLLLPLIALHVRTPRPAADLAALETLPAPGPAFACRVCLKVSGAAIGTDEGVLTLVDGWLHFTGLRTEFALRRADVIRTDGPTMMESGSRILAKKGPQIFIYPKQEAGLVGALRWWSLEEPVVEGAATWPPTTVHPSGVARSWRNFLTNLSYVAVSAALLLPSPGCICPFLVGFFFFWCMRLQKLDRLRHEVWRPRLLP